MRLSRTMERGFTLIELLISLAILGFLLALGVPNYTTWLNDSQISNAVESIAAGVRFAQAQAVTLNQPVRLVLNPATGTGGWTVQLDNAPNTVLRTGVFAEGSQQVTITPTPAAATTVTYTGLGRITANADASLTLYQVEATFPGAGTRKLDVVWGDPQQVFTSVKICDRAWAPPDPKACPT
jgi:type IV fimbrial biogenesis protein FimT